MILKRQDFIQKKLEIYLEKTLWSCKKERLEKLNQGTSI